MPTTLPFVYFVSALVLLLALGIVLFFSSSNAKVQRVGEILMFAAILGVVLVFAVRGLR